ncbi:hypothetical protein Vadar_020680 [Vaccinium darrowii]|uniref:Uncharacterized protein n=1 Tax=Vaccinium darrowii TaxID=229202 RepID=A0ACB7YNQ7_9ERIC|nr:hypothetical protein Vadar_020680 [Vaccinium darrowii]
MKEGELDHKTAELKQTSVKHIHSGSKSDSINISYNDKSDKLTMSNGDPESCSLAVNFFPMQRTTGWQPLMPTAVLPFRTASRAYSLSGDKTVMALMCIERKKIVGVALKQKETTGKASVATQMEERERERERERSGALQLPVLKVFEVLWLNNIVEIWDKQSSLVNEETVSYQLRRMEVHGCAKLMNLIPSKILPRLQILQHWVVRDCPNIQSVVFENGKEEEGVADHPSATDSSY